MATELSGGLVGYHEQHVEDAQRAPALQPFERADQLALEGGARAERKGEQLRGGKGHGRHSGDGRPSGSWVWADRLSRRRTTKKITAISTVVIRPEI
jgi:hypothetical protein